MNAIRAFLLSLLVFSGCVAAQQPASPETNVALPSATKVVVIACYVKRPTLFSSQSPAARDDFSDLIKSETDVFVRGLEKGLADSGFAVSTTITSGPCKVKDAADGGITIPVIFEMIHQSSPEDLIVARVFIKEFGSNRAVGVIQRKLNGVMGKVEARDVVADVVTETVTAVKAVQSKAVPVAKTE